MKKILFSLLVMSAIIFTSFAQDSNQLSAWNGFNSRYDGNWIIRWDETMSTPASIYGYKSEASDQISAGPAKVAKSFFEQNQNIFKMRSSVDQLILKKQFEYAGLHHLIFVQAYSNIPVHKGEYKVTIGNDGSLRMISGRFFPNVELNVNPTISPSEAEKYAMEFLKIESVSIKPVNELIIYPDSSKYRLAYKILLQVNNPLSEWLVIIDAVTSQIISFEDVTVHIDGSGYVYPIDPVNSSLSTAILPRLSGEGNYLESSFVRSLNEDQERAYSPNAQFFYTPPQYSQFDNTHFDEVNLYYHLDLFANHLINDCQFSGLGRVIEATAHVNTNWNNASYSLITGNLSFGDGDRIRFYDFAKKEDIIYHEFQHAVTHYLGLNYFGETAALHEGYSDYFAASYTQDYRIGEWLTICSSSGDLRIVSNDQTFFNYSNYGNVYYAVNSIDGGYLNPSGTAHANGMILSGTLWDLRSILGPSVTDFLALKGMAYMYSSAQFIDVFEGIIQADIDYYESQHVTTIMNTFAERGIGWSGNISSNTTWSGIVLVAGDISVASGITLTINSGSTVYFANDASLIVNGHLQINGTSGSNVVFDFGSPNSSTQNGIKINPGATIAAFYLNVQNAYRGIYFDESYGTVNYCTFEDCTEGLRFYRTNYAAQQPNLNYNTVFKNSYDGSGTGFACSYSSPYMTNNEVYNYYTGIGVIYNSSPYLGYSSAEGRNNLHDNFKNLHAISSSNPFLGSTTYEGYNKLEDAANLNLLAQTNCNILAEINWWGSSDQQTIESTISTSSSTVDFIPFLNSSPFRAVIDPGISQTLNKTINENNELFKAQEFIIGKEYEKSLQIINKYKNSIDLNDALFTFDLILQLKRAMQEDGLSFYEEHHLNSIKELNRNKIVAGMIDLYRSSKVRKNFTSIEEIKNNYKQESEVITAAQFTEFVIHLNELNDYVGAKNILIAAYSKNSEHPLVEAAIELTEDIEPEVRLDLPKSSPTENNMGAPVTQYSLYTNYPNPRLRYS